MNGELSSDNNSKLVYEISLNNKSLSLISPYLFVEKFKERILLKLPNIKVSIVYHTKGQAKEQALAELKCFSSKCTPDHHINNIKQEINSIYFNLYEELTGRIQENRDSVA